MMQASDELLRCMQQRWLEGRLSSLHYIQFLNSAAGRSTSNFSAYPVFPWVLQRYAAAFSVLLLVAAAAALAVAVAVMLLCLNSSYVYCWWRICCSL